ICSYIQSGGRLLRKHPSLDRVTVQDHGGNRWRHDSPNVDRLWKLDDTERASQSDRDEKHRTKPDPEPYTRPQRHAVAPVGPSCHRCGYTAKGKKRFVVETDGQLREVRGDIFRERKVSEAPQAHKNWEGCYWRCKKTGKTFAQAVGLFARENKGLYPGNDFPLMPKSRGDWNRKVADVPYSDLVPKP